MNVVSSQFARRVSATLLCLSTWGVPATVTAQEEDDEFEVLNLDDLLEMEVTVASMKPTTLRESPGIVSVVTRREMLDMGARDLIDVLRMVPGFFFAVDVQGVVGVGLRGNWAHEGKLLLIVDGHEMNEMGYQTLQFGHHYPVENLERVEIIRGPGSAIYGGNAELGVVKVTTRSGDTLRGGRASVRYSPPRRFYGGDGDKTGFGDVTLEAGNVHGDLQWSISGFVGRSVRGDDEYYSLYDPEPIHLGTESEIRPMMIAGSLTYRGVRFKLLFDDYELDSGDGFDELTELTHQYRHGGLYAEITHPFEIVPGLVVTPKFSYRRQQAWWSLHENGDRLAELLDYDLYQQTTVTRALAGVTTSWDMFSGGNLIVGVEGFYDIGVANKSDDPDVVEAGAFDDPETGDVVRTLDFATVALFAQFLWENPIANLTVGGRLEVNDQFGAFAVPRLALTRVFDFGLHTKLLVAQAFRTPSFFNYSLEKAIDPDNEINRERTTVLEAEAGYEWFPGATLVANGFVVSVSDPLIYVYDEDLDTEGYFNRETTGTIGAEFEARYRESFGSAMVSYAFYRRITDAIEDYEVPDSIALLGAPRHKITARATFELPFDLRVTPTLAWSFGAYGVTATSDEEAVKLPDEVLVGLGVRMQNIGVEGLDFGLFGHDLLDSVELYPQAYYGGHAPLPGRGRRIMARISYEYGR